MKNCKNAQDVINAWFEGKSAKYRNISSDGVTIKWKWTELAQRINDDLFAVQEQYRLEWLGKRTPLKYLKLISAHIIQKLDDSVWESKHMIDVEIEKTLDETIKKIVESMHKDFNTDYSYMKSARDELVNKFRKNSSRYAQLVKAANESKSDVKIAIGKEEEVMKQEKLHFAALVGE
jgi:hypothetical protein